MDQTSSQGGHLQCLLQAFYVCRVQLLECFSQQGGSSIITVGWTLAFHEGCGILWSTGEWLPVGPFRTQG